MSKIKKIVLQWPSFGPYHTARLRACQEMAPAGVEVVGLAVAGQVRGRPWVEEGELGGVQIVTLFPDEMYHELPKNAVKRAMDAALEKINPCGVGISGYGMVDSRTALKWCRQRGIVKVLMTESKADDATRLWWKERIKKYFVSQYDSAHCGGTPHRQYLIELGMAPEKIFDRYDVVDNERFKRASDAARKSPQDYIQLPGLSDIEQDAPFFLVSSRFMKRKNLSRLLSSYLDYQREVENYWKLVILGTGSLEVNLRRQVESENIRGVTFAGFQQFDSLVAYYAYAGALIHPALVEPWGLVINEAMACGLPIGSSKTVGAAHDLVIDGKNGFKFDPADKDSIREVLKSLSAPDTDRDSMSSASLELINEWTPEHFAENFWQAVQIGSQNI